MEESAEGVFLQASRRVWKSLKEEDFFSRYFAFLTALSARPLLRELYGLLVACIIAFSLQNSPNSVRNCGPLSDRIDVGKPVSKNQACNALVMCEVVVPVSRATQIILEYWSHMTK